MDLSSPIPIEKFYKLSSENSLIQEKYVGKYKLLLLITHNDIYRNYLSYDNLKNNIHKYINKIVKNYKYDVITYTNNTLVGYYYNKRQLLHFIIYNIDDKQHKELLEILEKEHLHYNIDLSS